MISITPPGAGYSVEFRFEKLSRLGRYSSGGDTPKYFNIALLADDPTLQNHVTGPANFFFNRYRADGSARFRARYRPGVPRANQCQRLEHLMENDSIRLYVDVQYRPELITGITAAAGRAVPAGAIRVSPRRRVRESVPAMRR